MKKYLAVFLGSGTTETAKQWGTMSPTEQKEKEKLGMKTWEDWAISHNSSIVEYGSPLGKTKRISPSGIADVRNELTAWVIMQADSHEAAAKMFMNHPHFSIFPGDAVEVMECLPMPTQ